MEIGELELLNLVKTGNKPAGQFPDPMVNNHRKRFSCRLQALYQLLLSYRPVYPSVQKVDNQTLQFLQQWLNPWSKNYTLSLEVQIRPHKRTL